MPYKDPIKQKEYFKQYREQHRNEAKKWREEHPYYRRQMYIEHREQELEKNRIWIQKHPDYCRQRYQNNKEQILLSTFKYQKEHPEQTKETIKRYKKSSKGKATNNRAMAKRQRGLGYTILNDWEVGKNGFVGHHLDKEHVLYIPEEIHLFTPHNVFTGKNMDIINEKVIDWYTDYYGLI